jgi:hypothetical protein
MGNVFSKPRPVGKLLLGLLVSTALASSCNNLKSGLKVAGGTIDGSDGTVRYPGTVYAELDGQDFNGKSKVIRNVGTLVDLGQPGQLALILSLADSIQSSAGRSILPLFKHASLKLYLSDGKDSITLPGMTFSNEGVLKDKEGRSYLSLTVGIKAEKIGSSDIPDDKVRSIAQKLFLESPLLGGGRNFRVPETAYMIIAVPRNSHPSLASIKAPALIAAEDRADEASLTNLQIAGFGENIVGGEKKNVFALSESLPSVMKRNYADVVALNKSADAPTPLKGLLGSSDLSKKLWEVGGSGLCGSSDGQNYDTGASVYSDGKFVGFAVRSSVKSSGYKGKLDCSKTSRDDMVSLVVSPSIDAIEMFKSRVK